MDQSLVDSNDDKSFNHLINSISNLDTNNLKEKVSILLSTISQQSKLLKLANLQTCNNSSSTNETIETSSFISTSNVTPINSLNYASPKIRRKSITSTLSVPNSNDEHSTLLSDFLTKSPISTILPMSRNTNKNKQSNNGKSSSFHPLFTKNSETFLSLQPSPQYDISTPFINNNLNNSDCASCYVKILRAIFDLYPNICSAGIYRLHPVNSNNNSTKSPKLNKDNKLIWRSIAYRSPEKLNIHFKKKLITLSSGLGLASYCADSQSTVNIANVHESKFFNKDIDAPLVKINLAVNSKMGFTAAFQNVLHSYPENTYRALCVPVLNASEKCIAVIEIVEPCDTLHISPFADPQVTLLESLANTASSVMLFSEYQQDRERAELLVDVMHSITNNLNTDDIISAVVRIIRKHVNAQHVIFYTVDTIYHSTDELALECKVNTLPSLPSKCKGFSSKAGEIILVSQAHSPIVDTLKTKSSVNILDVSSFFGVKDETLPDYSFPSDSDLFDLTQSIDATGRIFTLKSLIYLPILDTSNGEVIGIIQCINKDVSPSSLDESMPYYTPDDEVLLSYIAAQTATAISRSNEYSNALLSQKRTESLLYIVKASASADENNLATVIEKIMEVCYKMLEAERLSVFMVDRLSEELWCRVSTDSVGIRVSIGKGIVGHVAASGKSLNVPDVTKCEYFDNSIDIQSGFTTRNILCLPVVDGNGNVVAVMQAINKIKGIFTHLDEELLGAVIQEISVLSTEEAFWSIKDDDATTMISMYTQRFNTSRSDPIDTVEPCINQSPLTVQSNHHLLVMGRKPSVSIYSNAMISPLHPANLTRSSSFFSNGKLVDSATNSATSSQKNTFNIPKLPLLKSKTFTIPSESQLTSPANVINNTNSNSSPQSIVIAPQNLTFANAAELISPSKSSNSQAILKHKRGFSFSYHDTSINIPLRISESVEPSEYLSMQFQDDFKLPINQTLPHISFNDITLENIQRWDFDPFEYDAKYLLNCIYFMLNYLGLVDYMKIAFIEGNSSLNNFLHAVRDHYQDNIYHNFYHGFAVCHGVFMLITLCLKNTGFFRPIDMLGTLIAALCHDIDHPGVNNNFLIVTGAPFAILYNDKSVLENHHAALTFQLLQNRENDIFSNFTVSERHDLRRMIIGSILATDMQMHTSLVSQAQELNAKRSIQNSLVSDRQTMMNILVHGSDINNPILPLNIHIKWTDFCADEFFEQAETEKRIGIPVTLFMANKDSLSKAKSNLNFLEVVVAPLWTTLVDMFPELKPRLDEMRRNRTHWVHLIESTGAPLSARFKNSN